MTSGVCKAWKFAFTWHGCVVAATHLDDHDSIVHSKTQTDLGSKVHNMATPGPTHCDTSYLGPRFHQQMYAQMSNLTFIQVILRVP